MIDRYKTPRIFTGIKHSQSTLISIDLRGFISNEAGLLTPLLGLLFFIHSLTNVIFDSTEYIDIYKCISVG